MTAGSRMFVDVCSSWDELCFHVYLNVGCFSNWNTYQWENMFPGTRNLFLPMYIPHLDQNDSNVHVFTMRFPLLFSVTFHFWQSWQIHVVFSYVYWRHGEDVDERQRTWTGNRQKFPPPWAQDVDHRHKKDSSGPHGMAEDRDFRHRPRGREDEYRSRDYSRDGRLEYTEDQDYRSHDQRRKKRHGHSPDQSSHSKKSRHHDRDRHHHGRDDVGDRGNREEGHGGQHQKKGTDLPKPVPPPGVTSSSTGDAPPQGKGMPSEHRPLPPKTQPAPPGVDEWKWWLYSQLSQRFFD